MVDLHPGSATVTVCSQACQFTSLGLSFLPYKGKKIKPLQRDVRFNQIIYEKRSTW